MLEDERRAKITEFYNAKPDAYACDDCVCEISLEQVKRSVEATGLRYCGICLAVILARDRKLFEAQR